MDSMDSIYEETDQWAGGSASLTEISRFQVLSPSLLDAFADDLLTLFTEADHQNSFAFTKITEIVSEI